MSAVESFEFRSLWPRFNDTNKVTFLSGERLDGKRLGFLLDGLPVGIDEKLAPFRPYDSFGPRGRNLIAPNVVEFSETSVTLANRLTDPRKTFTLNKKAFPREGLPVVLFDAQHDNPREGVLLARPSTKGPAAKTSFD